MTQFYKQSGFTLARSNLSTKILLTLFLFTTLAGCVVAALQYSSRSGGYDSESARQWIQGNEEDLEAKEFISEKTPRELLSFIHDHIFSLGILLFVILHLVELTPWTEGPKIALSILGYSCLFSMLFSPLAIQSGSTTATYTQIIGGSGLLLTLTLGSFACLDELWWASGRRKSRQQEEPAPPAPLFPEKRTEQKSGGRCPLGHDNPDSDK
ncbi:MAG: hypothetical protein P8R38_06520 [Planctomycetota bacterium]|nr:hypothetical protein [Planctomycetota bacterium]MDG2085030.1 hypothetical protein [Planctomycetota bacterium]